MSACCAATRKTAVTGLGTRPTSSAWASGNVASSPPWTVSRPAPLDVAASPRRIDIPDLVKSCPWSCPSPSPSCSWRASSSSGLALSPSEVRRPRSAFCSALQQQRRDMFWNLARACSSVPRLFRRPHAYPAPLQQKLEAGCFSSQQLSWSWYPGESTAPSPSEPCPKHWRTCRYSASHRCLLVQWLFGPCMPRALPNPLQGLPAASTVCLHLPCLADLTDLTFALERQRHREQTARLKAALLHSGDGRVPVAICGAGRLAMQAMPPQFDQPRRARCLCGSPSCARWGTASAHGGV